MLEISLPGIFVDQGSGYPLRVSKVTLKWTDPVKMLTKAQLESNLGCTLRMVMQFYRGTPPDSNCHKFPNCSLETCFRSVLRSKNALITKQ